jgi:DNA primase
LDVTQGLSLTARVLAVPAGKDPDAYLRKEGPVAFNRLLTDAPGLVTYLLSRAIARADTTTREGRSQAVVACVPVLRQIENYVTRSHHVEWISERLGVREESIRLEIGKGMRHNVTPSRPGQITVKKLSATEAEQILLFAMVAQPSVIALVREALGAIPFEPVHEAIRSYLTNPEDASPTPNWDNLLDEFAGREDVQKVVSAIMFAEYNQWDTEISRLVSDCIDTLLRNYWEAELLALKQRLKLEGEQLAPEMNEQLVQRMKDLSAYCVHLKHKRSNLLPAQQMNEEKRGEGE